MASPAGVLGLAGPWGVGARTRYRDLPGLGGVGGAGLIVRFGGAVLSAPFSRPSMREDGDEAQSRTFTVTRKQ